VRQGSDNRHRQDPAFTWKKVKAQGMRKNGRTSLLIIVSDLINCVEKGRSVIISAFGHEIW
jgi:hypothetical protein